MYQEKNCHLWPISNKATTFVNDFAKVINQANHPKQFASILQYVAKFICVSLDFEWIWTNPLMNSPIDIMNSPIVNSLC
jgi:hypothetical protein